MEPHKPTLIAVLQPESEFWGQSVSEFTEQ
jgi:hypothetical protein